MSEIKQETQYKSLSGAAGGSNQQEQPSSSPVVQDMDKSHPKDNDITQSTLCCPSTLSCILGTLCPCSWICGCTTLDVNTEAVLTNFGKFMGVMRQPGCYCYNGCGTSFHYVSLKKEVLDLKAVKVADGRGNPVHLSGIATYQIIDSRRAVIDVQNPRNFVETQGLTVLKQIASQYPYEGKPGQHSLRSEQGRLKEDLVRELQKRVADAGVKVLSFEFTDMAYAPEIAKDMLIRQQAEAKLDARKVIAEGAVEIATTAMQHLAQKGIRMSEAEQARIVGQLLISLTSEGGVQPTMTVSSDQH